MNGWDMFESLTADVLRCIKAWLNGTSIYLTRKDYGIVWLISGSSSQLRCEVAKYSYTFCDPKYQSAPVIVAPWYLWWKAFEWWRQQSLFAFLVVCYDPENRYVSTAVDKNEQTRRCSTLHSQHFSTQSTSTSKDHPGSQGGKLRMKVWKNCDMICFWKWLIFQISVRQTLLSSVLLVVSGSPGVLVTTKTGGCCNKSRNPTCMEKSSVFCNISETYFSSPARRMWVWPKYDVINWLSLSIFEVWCSWYTASVMYVVWKHSGHALMHLRILYQ